MEPSVGPAGYLRKPPSSPGVRAIIAGYWETVNSSAAKMRISLTWSHLDGTQNFVVSAQVMLSSVKTVSAVMYSTWKGVSGSWEVIVII